MPQPTYRPIFIGGCERSGTTMLGALLGAAPGAITTPESRFRLNAEFKSARAGKLRTGSEILRAMTEDPKFAPWGLAKETIEAVPEAFGYREVMERLVYAYAQRHGTPDAQVWIDHTPMNVRYAWTRWRHFPEAKFIHIVRDGRAVAASVLPLTWGPNTICATGSYWLERVAHGVALETSSLGNRVIRVRYEDLLEAPEPVLRHVCEFCEIGFVPQMLRGGRFAVPSTTKAQHALVGRPPEPGRAQSWRQQLTAREIEIFEASAGEMLRYLGYEPMFGPEARPATDREMVLASFQDLMRRKWLNRLRKLQRRRTVPT